MLVTALAPHIGYEKAAAIARHAHEHGTSLRAAAREVGGLDDAQFDRWVVPERMTRPHE
jgi:fumarate hydratase class II